MAHVLLSQQPNHATTKDFVAAVNHHAKSLRTIPGFHPHGNFKVVEWFAQIAEAKKQKEAAQPAQYNDAVKGMQTFLAANPAISKDLQAAIEISDAKLKKECDENGACGSAPQIGDVECFLWWLNYICTFSPKWSDDEAKRRTFPMSHLFTYLVSNVSSCLAPDYSNEPGDRVTKDKGFNAALTKVLETWEKFLNGPESAAGVNNVKDGWLSPSAYLYMRLGTFDIPNENPFPSDPNTAGKVGWASWNRFFHREIKNSQRPLPSPLSPDMLTSPNDGTLIQIQTVESPSDPIHAKGFTYNLERLLNGIDADGIKWTDFLGGQVLQTFLGGQDYHAWRSPCVGRVKKIVQLSGWLFAPPGNSQAGSPKFSEYNTRALVFIDSPQFGLVCCMPIGISEVSSCIVSVTAGEEVQHGSPLGAFSFGGSTFAMVFQKNKVQFNVSYSPTSTVVVRVQECIGYAHGWQPPYLAAK